MGMIDGKGTAPSPIAIAACLIIGSVIWVLQKGWELIESIIGFIF